MPDTIAAGLSSTQAAHLLATNGPNQLSRLKRGGLLFRAGRIFAEPMLLLLLAAGMVSVFVAEPLDAAVLFVMIGFVAGITLYQEGRAEKALNALSEMSAPRATVMRDGEWLDVSSSEVVLGDLVKLEEGDRIPADIELVSASHLLVDESSLTGESIAVSKASTEHGYAGTLCVSGSAQGRVIATGLSTELGRISESLSEVKQIRTRLQVEIGRLVRIIAIIAASAAIGVATLLWISRGDIATAMLAGIATAMAMIPEEFPVVLALFFALGAWRLSKDRILARKSSVIETLGSATVICTDKTGTLTMNQMSVDQLIPTYSIDELARFGSLATRTDSFDPVDKAFLSLSPASHNLKLVRQYPLTPELTAMTLVWEEQDHWILACKGAPESIATICGLELEPLMLEVQESAKGGRRIIAVAGMRLPKGSPLPESQLNLQLEYKGFVSLRDPVRPLVPDAIQECRQAGIRVIMITGDYLPTAIEIAKEIGLPIENFITGPEIDELSDPELELRVREVSICARVKPLQKLRLVKALQSNGEVVAMTGDGVNDAPALKLADISLAMGLRGTDVAKEASNLVITDDDFSSIVDGIRRGRTLYAALRKSFSYIVAIHVPLLGMAIIPVLFLDWPLVLIPAMVAFIELVVDPACTIVFQAEPGEPNIMKRKPRPTNQKLMDRGTFALAIAQGLGVLVGALSVYLLSVSQGRPEDEVRTLTFAMLVLGNVMLILVNRSWTLTVVETFRDRRNPTVKWVVGAAIAGLLILVEIPALGGLFSLGPIGFFDWLLVLATVALSVSWFELYKLVSRRKYAI